LSRIVRRREAAARGSYSLVAQISEPDRCARLTPRELSLGTSICASALAAMAASSPLMSAGSAQQRFTTATSLNCRYIGAISHSCQSDATWREGLSSYHGSNGG
jgi:hypothetical protein